MLCNPSETLIVSNLAARKHAFPSFRNPRSKEPRTMPVHFSMHHLVSRNLMRALIALFVNLLFVATVYAQETVTINASGVGPTAEAAEKAALVNAVQQAVGLFLDSETLVRNEQVVYD